MTTTPRTAETITAEILAMDYPRAALLGHLSTVIDIAVIHLRSALKFDTEQSRRYFAELLADLEEASQVNQAVIRAINEEINAKYGLSTPAHSKS
jgi:hypothetical protein